VRVKPLLGLVVLATGGLWALVSGCVAEEEVEQEPTPAVTAAAPLPTSQPTLEPAVTPVPLTPTVVGPTPFVKPTVTPAPTATPQPGVCPTPYRTTPEDFANPPALRPASEIPGQRFQGGVPYTEAYVTVHLPVRREFVILSVWSQDDSNLWISIYDAQTGSSFWLRDDGCEIGRFVRDPAADAAFDEITKTLEIGTTYVCPVPTREVVSPPTRPTFGRWFGSPSSRCSRGAVDE